MSQPLLKKPAQKQISEQCRAGGAPLRRGVGVGSGTNTYCICLSVVWIVSRSYSFVYTAATLPVL
ncbi:hypothetical protein J6590_040230 [Homalodisca vitripennis]|nr:hypothetical protein J6590_040230 [Homalodisca vitripennis]